MNTTTVAESQQGAEPIFIELEVLMAAQDTTKFRAEGVTPEGVISALSSLTGDLDETATHLANLLLTARGLKDASDTSSSILDENVTIDFAPPLTGSFNVTVILGDYKEQVQITVTTSSIGAMIGSLFVHLSGAEDRARTAVSQGLNDSTSGGVRVTTNITRFAPAHQLDEETLPVPGQPTPYPRPSPRPG
jgi:hypothetical protein